MSSSFSLLSVALVGALFVTPACAASDDAATPASCGDLIDEAAVAIEVDAQLRSLDAALARCGQLRAVSG